MLRPVIPAKSTQIAQCVIKVECGARVFVLSEQSDRRRNECAQTDQDIPHRRDVCVALHGWSLADMSDGRTNAGTDIGLKRPAGITRNEIDTDRGHSKMDAGVGIDSRRRWIVIERLDVRGCVQDFALNSIPTMSGKISNFPAIGYGVLKVKILKGAWNAGRRARPCNAVDTIRKIDSHDSCDIGFREERGRREPRADSPAEHEGASSNEMLYRHGSTAITIRLLAIIPSNGQVEYGCANSVDRTNTEGHPWRLATG